MNKSKIIDYYDQCEIDYKLVWGLDKSLALHYGFWDRTTKNLPEALQRENQILAKLSKIKKSDVVLDAGCGVGGSSIYLAKNIGCKVTGITLAKKQVQSAKDNARRFQVENLTEFKVADYTNTKFKVRSFDVIWAIESSCYSKPDKFLKEAFRLLKPGGRIIVADFFNSRPNFNPREQHLMKQMASGWAIDSFNEVSDFKASLYEAGFTQVKTLNATKKIYPSAKKLYHRSIPGIAVGKLMELINLRTAFQNANIWTVFYQYKALKQNLWQYEVFYAEK